MKFTILVLLSVLSACGAKKTTTHFGKTTAADLIAEKGQPAKETTLPMKESKMFHYAGNEKFQISNDIVTHGFKDPIGDEKLILYWKHKFKDCAVQDRKISSVKSHTPAEHQMKCDALGLTVIYQEGSAYVSRVIEHEKK